MLRSAAKNGGYVDQKKFKTADKYGFDSMVIDDVCMHVLDDYVRHVSIFYRGFFQNANICYLRTMEPNLRS